MTTAAELLNAYQEDDVVSWLGADTVKKARPYVDLVQQLEVGTERISAQVPGSARQAYRTDIVFIDFILNRRIRTLHLDNTTSNHPAQLNAHPTESQQSHAHTPNIQSSA